MESPFKHIVIRIIPKGCMRRGWDYGDYWKDEHGALQIRVSQFDNHIDVLALLHHELDEAWMCAVNGVDYADIDKFDQEHQETDDPGLLKCAPYHHEHMDGEEIERLICHQKGRTWEDHYNAVPIGD